MASGTSGGRNHDEFMMYGGVARDDVGLECFAVRTVRPMIDYFKVARVFLRVSLIHCQDYFP